MVGSGQIAHGLGVRSGLMVSQRVKLGQVAHGLQRIRSDSSLFQRVGSESTWFKGLAQMAQGLVRWLMVLGRQD